MSAVTTTFGYNAAEDRLWLNCDAWPQRIWITRRMACKVLQAAAQAIEDALAPGDAAVAGPTPTAPAAVAELAAAEHDAALNRPQPGEDAHALRMGTESTNAAPLKDAVLCSRFRLTQRGDNADLVFDTPAGEQALHLSRVGLHRWMHALHLVMAQTQWDEVVKLPGWLKRSYLPPALKALLDAPLPKGDNLPDD
jgi:hypothetical protein